MMNTFMGCCDTRQPDKLSEEENTNSPRAEIEAAHVITRDYVQEDSWEYKPGMLTGCHHECTLMTGMFTLEEAQQHCSEQVGHGITWEGDKNPDHPVTVYILAKHEDVEHSARIPGWHTLLLTSSRAEPESTTKVHLVVISKSLSSTPRLKEDHDTDWTRAGL